MKAEEGNEGESIVTIGDVQQGVVAKPSTEQDVSVKIEESSEARDDTTAVQREEGGQEERENDAKQHLHQSKEPKSKAPHIAAAGRKNTGKPKQPGRYPYPKMAGGHYPMGRGPYAPPPYGYPGSSGPYGPPPPHYHPPHHPHHGMHMPPYQGGGPYHGHPPPPGMASGRGSGGNYPPPHYHRPPPYTMPYPPQYNNQNNSDSASISSKGSMPSKKKRTIEGVHESNMAGLPSAYAFRRTDSASSTTSTVTAGNNTSTDTYMTDDSARDCSSELPPLNMDGMSFDEHGSMPSRPYHHHRDFSADASTASSLSAGFSLASYEGPHVGAIEDHMMSDGMSKRHKGNDSAPMLVDTTMRPHSAQSMDGAQSNRFGQLSLGAKHPNSTNSNSSSESKDRNLFLTLSTSPINHQLDVDATPIKKNTSKDADEKKDNNKSNNIFKPKGGAGEQPKTAPSSEMARPSDTPTPPVHGEMGEVLTDDQSTLNRHLRGQSFTPLPHLSTSGGDASPSNAAFASGIAPQLSWSIAGDTPSLGDIAEWEEDNKSKNDAKNRPSSTTSTDTRNMMISPHDFQLWKEEHDLADNAVSGTTTPLPVFFDQSMGEGSENHLKHDQMASKRHGHPGELDYGMHQMFANNNGNNNANIKNSNRHMHPALWSKDPTADKVAMGMPPTPMFGASFGDDRYSPREGDRRESMDFYQPYYPGGYGGPNDRVRNLRGRLPPGAHLPPMPLHIPPPSLHLPMTSPMGLGPKGGLWSPHVGMPPLGSPHHMTSPLSSMSQSKRKCIPLKPPIPSKFQGDAEKVKGAVIPEFTSLVNFPNHISQKQSVNLPEGMRCCVMCGSACPCSNGGKKKANKAANKSNAGDGGPPRNNNGQDLMADKTGGYAIIPTQNKGLCTLCDVNVWVIVASGLEIKWCKGCKNFRPWAAFGDKGLATKCLRCRERQREKYALQKEEKEKARIIKSKKSA